MNIKEKAARATRIRERTLQLRQEFWPRLDEKMVWNRKREHGFTTIPRTMPLIMRIMDQLSKGKPVSTAYLTLWSRVFDEGVVEITNPRECAFEAGFTGERQESTWLARMRILKEQGFILAESAQYGEFSYVLIVNPYYVVQSLYEDGKVKRELYLAFVRRADEIGAKIPH